MYEKLFKGLFDSDLVTTIHLSQFLLCIGASLIIGIIIAFGYIYKSRYTRSFVITLSMLPAIVCVIIMMVNGNVGTGVAVAGAFSLVRFRSVPGSAKEIGMIFLAMATGLITGMGYIGYAFLFAIVFCIVYVSYQAMDFGITRKISCYKTVRVTIPENLDYTNVFDDVLNAYTSSYELTAVKTTNMGSMFRLTYNVIFKEISKEKEFIDRLRERNGNLEISVSVQETMQERL